jgi:hypothetical protein
MGSFEKHGKFYSVIPPASGAADAPGRGLYLVPKGELALQFILGDGNI